MSDRSSSSWEHPSSSSPESGEPSARRRDEETSDVDETRRVAGSDDDADAQSPEPSSGRAQVGDSFGRYVILRELGSGGMAHVYVAYDPELNREVAVKLMRPGGPEAQAASGERLLREAQAMARLEHVNVVRVYDVGIVDGRVWMAMELIRGVDFEEWLKQRTRPWREIVSSLVHAGRGLAAAHAAGIVHLDFKPRNVLVGDDGEIRVVDFGLARPPRTEDRAPRFDFDVSGDSLPVGRLTDQITEFGLVMGTPGYMAPELLKGGLTDARTDQFSFCVTLWKALYGRRPFGGSTTAKVNAAVLAGRIEPPPSGSRVPARLRRLLERGLAAAPEARFASLDALLDELERDPFQPYKRLGLAVLAAGAVGVGAWGYVGRQPATGPACDTAASQLKGVWDDDRRAAAKEAVTADPRAFVADTWEKVDNGLDDYAAQWVEMHTDSCRATHQRGEQSEEMLDRRTHCLNERLTELQSVTDLLAHADATVVERAVTMVGRLSPVAGCADVRRLQEQELPTDPNRLAAMERAQTVGLQALVLRNAGKYAEALALGSASLLSAERSGHLPTIAWARISHAGLLGEYGDAETAESFAFEGLLAAEAAGDDERRANALIEMVFVSGMLLGKYEAAEEYARIAQAVIDGLGNPRDAQARLWSNLGAVVGTTGDADRSIELYKRVLAAHDADTLLDDENLSSVYLGIGSALFWENRYEEALPYYDLAERMLVSDLGALHPRTATAYENLGTVNHAMGNFEEALHHFERALEVVGPSETAPERLGSLYNGMGAALEGLERYDEAGEWFRRSIERIDDKNLKLPVLGVSLANLGGNLIIRGRPAEAVPYYERAMSVMRETFVADSIWIQVMACSEGYARLLAGDTEVGAEHMLPAIDRFERESPEHDPLYRGECRLYFATALLELGPEARSEAVQAAARERSASQWADLSARDLEGEMPRSRLGLERLAALRKRLRQAAVRGGVSPRAPR
jgi:tetratricopeptide (TPR) repeat protein/predicted Ser/Thr protein kinase